MSANTRGHVIKNPYVLIDGHDFSNLAKSVTVNRQKDELDTTASGDGGHTQIQGLSKDNFQFSLYQDRDYSVLDRVIADAYEAETQIVVEVAPSGSTVSESNPSFTGNCRVFNHVPLGGDVGALSMLALTLSVDGAISRSGT